VPAHIRSDNGSEFTARNPSLQTWYRTGGQVRIDRHVPEGIE